MDEQTPRCSAQLFIASSSALMGGFPKLGEGRKQRLLFSLWYVAVGDDSPDTPAAKTPPHPVGVKLNEMITALIHAKEQTY